MKKYITPDFDVTVYEIEDRITLTITDEDPDGMGDSSWHLGDSEF